MGQPVRRDRPGRGVRILALGVPVLILVATQPALAAAGDPDATFGSGGSVSTAIGGDAGGNAVAIQPDGKIVVAGYAIPGGGERFGVVRYDTTGGLDASFDTDGRLTTTFGSMTATATSVAIQPDGKIVVAGNSNNGGGTNVIALARYHPWGALDTTFSGNGKVTISIGSSGNSGAHAVAIQPSNGKVVVAGYALSGSGHPVFAVARFDANGVLDTSFGGNGKVTTPVGSSAAVARSVAVQPNGKIVTAGYAVKAGHPVFALTRYRPNGHLDGSFSGTGKVTTAVGSFSSIARSVAIANGKIVAAGYTFDGPTDKFGLARYKTNGTLDGGFGAGGKVTTAMGSSAAAAHAVAIQANGKIVAAGSARNGSNSRVFALARYKTSGLLDLGFSGNGKVTTLVGPNGADAYGVAIQASDGNIVVAGAANNGSGSNNFAVARYDDV